MKGLKIIPFFLVLIILSYVGVLFVQNNPGDVVIVFFGDTETPPLALGFVVLTSALVGMLFAGVLCLLELVVLYLQNKSLKRKLDKALKHQPAPASEKHLLAPVVVSEKVEQVVNDNNGAKDSNPSKAVATKSKPTPSKSEKEKIEKDKTEKTAEKKNKTKSSPEAKA